MTEESIERPSQYRFSSGWATHVGHRRELNEDSALVMDDLFAVADGMGGHEGGEIASSLCVKTLEEGRQERAAKNQLLTVEALQELLTQANGAVVTQGRGRFGTTLTLLTLIEHEEQIQLAVCNVGDSRTYMLRSDVDEHRFLQLTEDHSAVQEMINDGVLSVEEAREHPSRNVITRAVGTDVQLTADLALLHASVGDRFLLCSDGLSNEVDDETIARVLASGAAPQEVADTLVQHALDNGGRDNITVIIVEVLSVEPQLE